STALGAKGEARTPSRPLFAPGAGAPTERRLLIVGAPPSVRRVKPEHRAGPCSHPGRVLLQERHVLIVGAPPPVRRVKPEHRTSRYSHPGRVLLRRRCVLDCRSTALGAKGEARTPNQPLFAPGAGAPTQEARA